MWMVYRNGKYTGIMISNYAYEIKYLTEKSRITGNKYKLVKWINPYKQVTNMINQNYYIHINNHALTLIKFYKVYKDLAGNDQWERYIERQSFRDALESLKRERLINDYDLDKCSITTIKGRILPFDYIQEQFYILIFILL